MEGSLPNSLKHIISNAEYYGPSLFLLATDVVTAYVFQVRLSFLNITFSASNFGAPQIRDNQNIEEKKNNLRVNRKFYFTFRVHQYYFYRW